MNHETLSSMDAMVPLMKEALSLGRSVRFSPKGISMLPMLRQGRDSVVLSPAPERLRKYDIPLYLRDNGQYVLHRIVESGDTYTCLGDNQFQAEPGVRADQIIGVVTAFYRDERMIPVTNIGYRLYCRLWHHTRPLRHFSRRAIGWLKRHGLLPK